MANDQNSGPKALRDPLQVAVRILLVVLILVVVGAAVWALFFRTAEVIDSVDEGAAPAPHAPLERRAG